MLEGTLEQCHKIAYLFYIVGFQILKYAQVLIYSTTDTYSWFLYAFALSSIKADSEIANLFDYDDDYLREWN